MPGDASLYLQRAGLYREHQEWPKALADVRRVQALLKDAKDLKHSQSRYVEALIHLESGQAREAKTILDGFLRERPNDAAARIARARTCVALKNDLAAAEDFAAASPLLKIHDPDFFLDWAQCLARAGKNAAALAVLNNGTARLGAIPSLQLHAVDLLMAEGDWDGALMRVGAMEKPSEMRPDLMQLRGEILLKAQRRAEAREVFEFALASIENQPSRMNPRLQAIRTAIRSHLRDLY